MAVETITEFITTVIYSQNDIIVIQITASNVDHITGYRSKTNIITYLFKMPKNETQDIPTPKVC